MATKTTKTAKKTTGKKTAKKAAPKNVMRKSASAARPAATKPAPVKQAKPAKPTSPKRVSLLDAAVTVLKSAKAPMTSKEIVSKVVTGGLWKSPGGKTPHASLYAAMIREITKKGKGARFEKVDRGQFVARKRA